MNIKNSVILVVDDDPVVRRFIKDVTKAVFGYTIKEASSIEEALEAIKEETPSLIFFDHFLPDGTGEQFCNKLSKIVKYKSIPKWFITGTKPLAWNSNEWSSLGVCGYLVKPIGIESIVNIMEQSLGKRDK